MTRDEIYAFLEECGVILKGHFLLTSGRHSDLFMQCSQLLQYPEKTAQMCKLMAAPFQDKNIETVIGPAMGGVILSYETARQLGTRAIFAEQEGAGMVLRRGFTVRKNERVLVVEDAVTTGGSVQKVLDILKELEARIVGVSVLVDRSPTPPDFGAKMHSLLKLSAASHLPEDCPLCQEGVPLVRPKR